MVNGMTNYIVDIERRLTNIKTEIQQWDEIYGKRTMDSLRENKIMFEKKVKDETTSTKQTERNYVAVRDELEQREYVMNQKQLERKELQQQQRLLTIELNEIQPKYEEIFYSFTSVRENIIMLPSNPQTQDKHVYVHMYITRNGMIPENGYNRIHPRPSIQSTLTNNLMIMNFKSGIISYCDQYHYHADTNALKEYAKEVEKNYRINKHEEQLQAKEFSNLEHQIKEEVKLINNHGNQTKIKFNVVDVIKWCYGHVYHIVRIISQQQRQQNGN